jgi:hypothetical protein
MDPDAALGLVKHGATLLLLDVPQHTLVGFDTQVRSSSLFGSWETVKNTKKRKKRTKLKTWKFELLHLLILSYYDHLLEK